MKRKNSICKPVEKIYTSCSYKDFEEGVVDEYGVMYSKDGKRLLKCYSDLKLSEYKIKSGTEAVCNYAFSGCETLQSIEIPWSIKSIGDEAFYNCSDICFVFKPFLFHNLSEAIGEDAFPSSCKVIRRKRD